MLLPIRIETVLDQPSQQGGEWFLRFRLIPDAVSIVRTDVDESQSHGDATATRTGVSAVLGLPPTIVVHVEHESRPPTVLALTVDREQLTLPSTNDEFAEVLGGDPHGDSDAPDNDAAPWWLTYRGAERVGLGGRISLGADPGVITAIYVSGVGTDSPDAVFGRHAQRSHLGRATIGMPTNAVAGGRRGEVVEVKSEEVGTFFDATSDARPLSSLLAAMWPALFGDALEHVFGVDPDALDQLAVWAQQYLAPLGKHDPICVKDVPYGVFAVTALTSPASPQVPGALGAVSLQIAPIVATLRQALAKAAEARPALPSEGDELAERIQRLPTSQRFRIRAAKDVINSAADAAYVVAAAEVDAQGLLPKLRHLFPAAGSEPLLREVYTASPEEKDFVERMLEQLTHKLEAFPGGATVADLPRPERTVGIFIKLLDRSIKSEVVRRTDAAGARLKSTLALLHYLAEGPDIEWIARTVSALLDTAAHRIDPWAVGIAEQRWESAAAEVPTLGVYGWLDGPITPSQLAGTYTFAPSTRQAMVAALALDRFLTESDPDSQRWQIAMDSSRVRVANQLADDVRAGHHLSEAIGRRVERWASEELRQALRAKYPRRTGQPGRRTADGLLIVAAWQANKDLGVGAVPPEMERELGLLTAGIDTYADLLVFDGLHHVVGGRSDLAKASLDAAAGLGAPPPLDALRTPRSYTDARTTVLGLVPFVPLSPDTSNPYEATDPSMHAYINRLADAEKWHEWHFRLHGNPDGNGTQVVHEVPLTTLGIDPATAAMLPPATLHLAVRIAADQPLDCQIEEPSQLARLRRHLDSFRGDPPTSASAELAVVGDISELHARLQRTLHLAHQLVAEATPGDMANSAARRAFLAFGLAVSDAASVDAATAALQTRITDATREAADLVKSPESARYAVALRRLLGSDDLTAITRSVEVPPIATVDETFRIDWLGSLSEVRGRLADVDLELLDPLPDADLVLRSNHQDAWQRSGRPENSMLVAFGRSTLPTTGGLVAATVVDSFAESIPRSQHDAAIAFHFDAPAARAPQAILLAVAPQPENGTLSDDEVMHILRETRELAHARMFQLRDDPVLAAVLPLTVYPPYPLSGGGRLP